MIRYYFRRQGWFDFWHTFWRILFMVNRRSELHRLVRWAKRKKYAAARRWYLGLIDADERKLFRLSLEHPRLTNTAYRIHRLTELLFPPPKYFRVGSARRYR